jgi:protein arginine N-methyltransferase 5
MVVGAGPRGPLVDCCLRASVSSKVPIRVYAIEKNPNAFVSLQHKHSTMWEDDKVTIVFSDMRTWKAPEKCDILVSELLGSFGDNEVSPECLDGVQHVIKGNPLSALFKLV